MLPPCAATIPRCRTGTCGRRYQCLVIIDPKIVVTCWLKFMRSGPVPRARCVSKTASYDLAGSAASARRMRYCVRSVQSPDVSPCRAPIATSRRSVVARSAPMPFSSCPIDLTPLVDLGSVSISRSFRFRRHSAIAFQGMAFLPVIYQGIMPDLSAPCTRRCVATSLKLGNVARSASSRSPLPHARDAGPRGAAAISTSFWNLRPSA